MAPTSSQPSLPRAFPETKVGDQRWTKTCRIELPADWVAAMNSGRVDHDAGIQPLVRYLGQDGSVAMQYLTPSLQGANRYLWEPREGTSVLIDDFAAAGHSGWQVLAASFDGRYLAYSVLLSPHDLNGWKLFVWDSNKDDPPVKIADSDVNADGGSPGGPLNYPTIIAGQVFWPQVRKGDGIVSHIYRYTVQDGKTQQLELDNLPTRVWSGGSSLIWAGAKSAKEFTTLRAVDAATLEPRALPAALTSIMGPLDLAAAVPTFAWSLAEARSLWIWRDGWKSPVKAISVPDGMSVNNVRVAGHFVTWDDLSAQWIIDLRTGGYAKLTAEYGSTEAEGGPWLSVGAAPIGPKGASISEQALINTSGLSSFRACAR